MPEIKGTVGNRLRVMIADDASVMRARLRRMLEDSDAFDIAGEGGNGEKAVQLADLFQPDVLSPPAVYPEPDAFRLAFDHAPTGMAVLDREGRFQEVNEAFCRLVARRPAALVGDHIDEISHPDDIGRHAGLRLHMLRSLGDGCTNPAELTLIRPGGHLTWTMVTWCVRRTGDGSPEGFVAQLVDISERKLAEVTRARAEGMPECHERELGQSSADLAPFATFEGPGRVPARLETVALDLLLVEDDDGHARLVEETLAGGADGVYRLRRAHDLAGARIELQSHRTDCILLDLFLPDGQGLEALAQLVTLEPLVPIVILTSLADEQLGLQAVHQGAQDYLVKGTIDGPRLSRSLRHAIERKSLEARFAEQALHDPLTGLANRTLLFDRLRLEIARTARSGAGVAVFYLDVDGFKGINDQWGHDAGDEVLVRVARRLSRLVRPGDTVGRIGGDEFVVVCCGLETAADLDQMQARIADAVGRPMPLGGGTEVVTASIGAAIGLGPAEEPEAIIRRADDAMYQAKRRRRLAHSTPD